MTAQKPKPGDVLDELIQNPRRLEITMRRDYDNCRGPKSFVLLKHSHHLSFIDEPDNLTSELRMFLLN
jgi:hypothetical protein